MAIAIGIDFGTTNCSASCLREGRLELIPLENGSPILPSTLCITRDHRVHFGRQAVEFYLQITRGTSIRYKFTDLRLLTSLFEAELQEQPITRSESGLVFVSNAGEEEDLDRPARLFQSLKTGLRDPTFHGTTIFGRYYALEELIGLILAHIRECAERTLGQTVDSAVIGRPVSYAPAQHPNSLAPEEIDRTAHERMLAAARLGGFRFAALEFEPVAAARHLRARYASGTCSLVFDFGGGTLDLAIERVRPPHDAEVIATHGVPLGGDDLDSAIMRHSLLKHFGAGTTLGPKRLPFPPNLLAPLAHWQTIPLLATPASMARIAAIKRQSNAPHTVENLQTLIRQGLGFQLFRRIEAAKIALSDALQARVVLDEAGLPIDEEITRATFVEAINDHLAEIERGIRVVLEKARRSPDEIDAVLMTGGSSLVPIVQSTMRRLFGEALIHVADPFTSIVAGLGLVAAEDDPLRGDRLCQPVADVVSEATAMRLRAEAVTIGETVAFKRGHQTVEGVVVRRAGGRLHDATLVIEFWDDEIGEFVSTMRHETKVKRVKIPR